MIEQTMRILITGSREWDDEIIISHALSQVALESPQGTEFTVIEGQCPYGGADALAAKCANEMGWAVESHPADWKGLGKSAGPTRNQEMVDSGADICLAFPLPQSRGTLHCINAAKDAGIPVRIYDIDGRFSNTGPMWMF